MIFNEDTTHSNIHFNYSSYELICKPVGYCRIIISLLWSSVPLTLWHAQTSLIIKSKKIFRGHLHSHKQPCFALRDVNKNVIFWAQALLPLNQLVLSRPSGLRFGAGQTASITLMEPMWPLSALPSSPRGLWEDWLLSIISREQTHSLSQAVISSHTSALHLHTDPH